MILDVTLDADQYILINLYNANTETEQCKIFNDLQSLLKFFDINQDKRIIFASDFNVFFISKLEAIWSIINPKRQNFTFRQNHSSGFIERRLNYICISNCLQEFVNYTYVLPAILTDHSPVLFSLSNDNSDNNGRGFW